MKDKQMNDFPRPDVPIDKAMFLSDSDSDRAVMVEHGVREYHHSNGWPSGSAGACWDYYRKADSTEKLIILMIEGFQHIIRDKVNPMAVHKSLCQVKDYRDSLAADVPGSGNK